MTITKLLLVITYVFSLFGCESGGEGSNSFVPEDPVPDLETPLSLVIPDVTTATRQYYLGTFTIDKITEEPKWDITNERIYFTVGDGKLCDATLYDRQQNEFNFDGLYEVSNGSESYYFRFGWNDCPVVSIFSFVVWEGGNKPPAGIYNFYVVEKDIPQVGNKTFSTIGDSITWNGTGEYFRGLLDRVLPEYIYTGSRTDTFGYGHEGEGGNNTQAVLNRLSEIEDADIYFLHIGTNDRFTEIETINNIIEIVDNLLLRDNSSIVYMSTILPRTRDPEIDQRNIRINQQIRNFVDSRASKRIRLAELENNFRVIDDWDDLLRDGLHPNLAGYKEMVRIISNEISQYD